MLRQQQYVISNLSILFPTSRIQKDEVFFLHHRLVSRTRPIGHVILGANTIGHFTRYKYNRRE